MINQLQQHIVATFGTNKRVLAKAFEEALCERLWRQHIISSGVVRDARGKDLGKILSGLFIAYIAMKPVISDSLKTLWQDMLDHASDEFEDGQPFMFDLFGFVVMIPVSDGSAVIAFDTADRDRRRDDIFRQVMSQSFSARRHITFRQKGNKAFWIFFPGSVDVLFDGWIGNIFPQHVQQVILPFSVEQFVWDVRERFPFSFWGDTAGSHEDMKVWVVMAGPAGSLQNDNVADIKVNTSIGPQDILQTGMTCPHEWAEQIAIAIEPGVKEIRHGQDDMLVCYTGYEPSSDVIGPSIGVDFGARQTEAGFTCEGDAAGFSTKWATVLYKAHLFRVAAVQHFLHCLVVFWAVVTRIKFLELIPVALKNTLKGVLVNAFHGSPLRTTIDGLT